MKWLEGEAFQKLYAEYEHPLYKRMGELAVKMGGHGGMDFIMLAIAWWNVCATASRLDQNVYEGALWSAVRPLSAKSEAEGGAPQKFPGLHPRPMAETTQPLGIVS
jgi:hypothetical protein